MIIFIFIGSNDQSQRDNNVSINPGSTSQQEPLISSNGAAELIKKDGISFVKTPRGTLIQTKRLSKVKNDDETAEVEKPSMQRQYTSRRTKDQNDGDSQGEEDDSQNSYQ